MSLLHDPLRTKRLALAGIPGTQAHCAAASCVAIIGRFIVFFFGFLVVGIIFDLRFGRGATLAPSEDFPAVDEVRIGQAAGESIEDRRPDRRVCHAKGFAMQQIVSGYVVQACSHAFAAIGAEYASDRELDNETAHPPRNSATGIAFLAPEDVASRKTTGCLL